MWQHVFWEKFTNNPEDQGASIFRIQTLTLQAAVWHDNCGAGILLKHAQSLAWQL